MPRKIISILLTVLLFLLVVIDSAMSENNFFTVSYTTYDTTYEAILKMYLKVINGWETVNYGRHDLFNNLVMELISPEDGLQTRINYTKTHLGYLVYDINKDGIDELLIGTDCGWIHEVFTIDSGKVRELIRAGAAGTASSVYSCALLDNGLFFRHYHPGGGMDNYELWKMNGTGAVSYVEGYHTDQSFDWQETDDPDVWKWFIARNPFPQGNVASVETRISTAQGDAWLREQENKVERKRFIPLSVYEKFPDDPWNIAVLSLNGKTSGEAKINIRKKPTKRSGLVVSKKVGTYVKILSDEGDYYMILIEGKEGYVQKDFITVLTEPNFD